MIPQIYEFLAFCSEALEKFHNSCCLFCPLTIKMTAEIFHWTETLLCLSNVLRTITSALHSADEERSIQWVSWYLKMPTIAELIKLFWKQFDLKTTRIPFLYTVLLPQPANRLNRANVFTSALKLTRKIIQCV